MASTNKCLAENNKSRTGGKATNERPRADKVREGACVFARQEI
jgi:hypothetical protein